MTRPLHHRYRLEKSLNHGAQGHTFLATDTWLERPVVLKIAASQDGHRALINEFATMYRLQHPHIAGVYELGSTETLDISENNFIHADGTLPKTGIFLSSAWCVGNDAGAWASSQSPEEIVTIIAQIAAALAYLHVHDITHADIKPENIMVSVKTDQPSATLIDFGLAHKGKHTGASGTLRYMAPEVLNGTHGPQADIYSLGATLAQLLRRKTLHEQPGSQLHAPVFSEIVAGLTHPDPQQRLTASAAFDLLLELAPAHRQPQLRSLRDFTFSPAQIFGVQNQNPLPEPQTESSQRPTDAPQKRGCSVITITGAPGCGKTSLLREYVVQAIRQDCACDVVHVPPTADLGELLLRCGGKNNLPPRLAIDSKTATHTALLWQAAGFVTTELMHITTLKKTIVVIDGVLLESPLFILSTYLQRLGIQGPHLLWLQTIDQHTDQLPCIKLEPLSVQDTQNILRCARPLRPLDQTFAANLFGVSRGNPGGMLTTLRHFPGDKFPRAAQDGSLRPPEHRDLLTIFARLSPMEQNLLVVLAQFPQCIEWKWLQDMPSLLTIPAIKVDTLIRQGFIYFDATTPIPLIGFGSTLPQDRIAEKLSAELAQELVGKLREVKNTLPLVATLGRILAKLGQSHEASAVLAHAAELAQRSLHFHEAIRLRQNLLNLPGVSSATAAQQHLELGELYLAQGSFDLAKNHFHSASLDLATQTQAHEGLAEVLIRLGSYNAAVLLLTKNPVASLRGTSIVLLCRALMLQTQYSQALAIRKQRPLPTDLPLWGCELLGIEALIHYYEGRTSDALALLTTALDAAERHLATPVYASPDKLEPSNKVDRTLPPPVIDNLRAQMALVLQKSGDFPAAEHAYLASLEAARRNQDLSRQVMRLTNLGTLRHDQGRIEEALADYHQATYLAGLINGKRELVRLDLNTANLLSFLGDYAHAQTRAMAALQNAIALGLEREKASLYLLLAEIHIGLEHYDSAHEFLANSADLFRRQTNEAGLLEVDILAAAQKFRQGHYADALEKTRSMASALRLHGSDRMLIHTVIVATLSASALADQRLYADILPRAQFALTRAQKRNDDDLFLIHACLAIVSHRAGQSLLAEQSVRNAHESWKLSCTKLTAEHERSYVLVWYRQHLLQMLNSTDPFGPEEGVDNMRDFERLLAINRAMASEHDPERLLERILDQALALSGAERGFILLRNVELSATIPSQGLPQDLPDEKDLVVRVARNMDEQTLQTTSAQEATSALKVSRSIALQAMLANQPISTIDAAHDDRFRDYRSVHNLQLRSVLCVPLRHARGVRGALYLDHPHKPNAFSNTDITVLSAFADQAAVALANAEMVSLLSKQADDLETSRRTVEDLNERLQKELQIKAHELAILGVRDQEIDAEHFGMVGRSAKLQEVLRIVKRVADKDVTVTILGESGTGKELVARAIHQASLRKGENFVSVNCGAIASELLESELFGHEKGAFTGAVRRKPGLFEIANGGTLFLDEIGDMRENMQVKLLRVLQQKEFRRVGGLELLHTNVRVITATNKPLEAMVRAGRFREDLWYRLNIVLLPIPPLRERRDDIPLLANHFLRRFGGEHPPKLTRKALAQLLDYGWPGNIRELENEMQRAVALADNVIEGFSDRVRGDTDHFSESQHQPNGQGNSAPNQEKSLESKVQSFEHREISATLEKHNHKVARAAKALGLTRAGLYKKIQKYGIKL